MIEAVGGNSGQGGSTAAHSTTPALDFAAYDQLPLDLRIKIATCAYPPAAERVLTQYRRALDLTWQMGKHRQVAADALALWIQQFEEKDIGEESSRHQLRYGRDLPHVAAGVSIQRGWGQPLRVARSSRRRPHFV